MRAPARGKIECDKLISAIAAFARPPRVPKELAGECGRAEQRG